MRYYLAMSYHSALIRNIASSVETATRNKDEAVELVDLVKTFITATRHINVQISTQEASVGSYGLSISSVDTGLIRQSVFCNPKESVRIKEAIDPLSTELLVVELQGYNVDGQCIGTSAPVLMTDFILGSKVILLVSLGGGEYDRIPIEYVCERY